MVRSKSTLFALSLCAALVPGIALAQNAANGGPAGGMRDDMDAAGPALNTNEGHFLCTAAITAAGGVFSGQYVNAALTGKTIGALDGTGLPRGAYQVAFLAPCSNVQIANGWFRICQIDTLTIGTVNGTAPSRIALMSPPRSGWKPSMLQASRRTCRSRCQCRDDAQVGALTTTRRVPN